MKIRSKLVIGLSALAAGGTLAAGITTQGFALSAFATDAPNAKKAAQEAGAARKAIAKRKAGDAVAHAEAAVANDPQNAEYRALLGQAYLLAGRFASANQALADTLTLNPGDGRAALNLVLAKIAGGDWPGARAMLDSHEDTIPAADRGLAYALAGDPVKAVEILGPAARAEDATAKTRQNLALALALSGRWAEAKQVASVDVAPDQLNARMMQWVNFARPTNAYDQVAALLNVTPVQDLGQPVRLALAQQNVMLAAATVQPVQTAPAPEAVDTYMPGVPANAEAVAAEAGVSTAVAAAAPAVAVTEANPVAGTNAGVVFGPRAEVVQSVPVAAVRASAPSVAVAAKAPRLIEKSAVAAKPSRGNFYVQLGAYVSPAVARDAWNRMDDRVPGLAGQTPYGAKVSTKAGNFYRLSVGGYDRSGANALCQQIKSSGQTCFVRAGAGDATAAWVKPGTRLAAR
ncbi:Flp pilus assembly protein TadD [Sphingomonas kyeonggiensis]|uniref:Flp pilus assembly protein TadD n=1 Tax=Sphingomonas kyeonggiensis TaxID=1268553 RepID=A0A7W7K1Y6_9SPHN|nr:SPOR domain-containing protein [Sphingomonas kyeonggiensis]MBB4839546.1 Flp pilus assembly protein TadD [Sphingomonas kyeonggiensis]